MSENRGSWFGRWGWVLLVVAVLVAHQRFSGSIRLVPAARAAMAGELIVRGPDGDQWTLQDLRGEVVVLNLWATWCGPCRREVPRLSRLHDELAAEGLRVLAINAESFSGDRLREAAERLGIEYPVAEPVAGLEGLGGGDVLPYIWLVDRNGRLRASHGGLASERALRRACRELLDEPAADAFR